MGGFLTKEVMTAFMTVVLEIMTVLREHKE